MKIYSVLITSNYDGEDLTLFTSLRNAFDYIQENLTYALEIHDLPSLDKDFKDFSYQMLKNRIKESEVNCWIGNLYSDYRTTFEVRLHNTKNSNYTINGAF